MFKLLIVDDEKIVIDAVSFIIERNFSTEITMDSARTGREAIVKNESFNPDIVLMDIRMPGINGIDAITEMKNTRPNINFIIISAYEQFEYAKEALTLGVKDYVLKPIIKNDLINIIDNVIKRLTYEREKRMRELENIEKYQNVIPFLEYGFIYSILLGESYGRKVDRYKEILGLYENGGYIMILESEEKDNIISFEEKLELDAEQAYYKILRDAFKYKCPCLIGPAMINRVVIFVESDFSSEYNDRVEAFEVANYALDKLKSFSSELNFNIGIGSCKKLENISSSYEEALRALHYPRDKGIVHIKDIISEMYNLTEYPKDQENRLKEMIILADKDSAFDAFKKIYTWINENYKDSFEIGKWRLIELMIIIDKMAFDFGGKEDNKSYLFNMNNIQDYSLLENYCRERIINIIGSIKELHNKKVNKIIINAKRFINENFNKEITLEEVSKEVSVSPHYFSRLFKEETSVNFIEYLTRIRIDKAKEFMKSSNLNIKEICFEIGYTDPNYFSYIFKKNEKITPSEYIKNFNKG
ncbi:MAG: response regulator [Clostridiaceae bacterium]|nr:response regulator [Clostridiaceae bacterium]